MAQSKQGSLVEALVNTAVGIAISFTANFFILPTVGCHTTFTQNLYICVVFTFISIARGYLLRRAFNAWRRFDVRD